MDWFNHRRLLEPIATSRRREQKPATTPMLEEPAMAARLKPNGFRQTRSD
jgi:hypothetical protein